MNNRTKLVRVFCGVALLLVAFVMMANVSPVGAAFMSCRADPIVYLSDGTVLTIVADIGTDVSGVTKIDYTVHVPKGTKLVKSAYTPMPGFTGKENLVIVADMPVNQYITDTVVKTKDKVVSVTATSSITSQFVSVTGTNGQHLKATLTR